MIEITPAALISIVGFVLLLIGVGAAVPSAILRQNAAAYKERAEQSDKELKEMREELRDQKRDFRILREEHVNLKDKYIQVLEEGRNSLRALCADVLKELRELKKPEHN